MHHRRVGVHVGQGSRHKRLDLPHAQGVKVLQQPVVPLIQHRQFRRDVLQPVPQLLQLVAGGVERQRIGQVIGEPDVIHDVAALLAMLDPVGAGNGLQEGVLTQLLVDVHHLFDGRIEPRQQHVAHDQERDPGVFLVRIFEVEAPTEVVHGLQARRLLAGVGDEGRFIGAVG